MLYEKQNKPFTGLDDLTSLPGEAPLDKTMLWQKLEARQEPKKKRLHTAWYWAAAALICMMALYPLLTGNNKQQEEPVAKEQENKIISPMAVAEEKAPLIINGVPSIKEREPVILHKKQIKPSDIIVKNDIPSPVQIIPEEVPQKSLALNPVLNRDTAPSIVSIRTPKKLPVVHLNELEQEDRIAEENISKIRSVNSHRNKTPKDEYAGAFNFRIHLKN